MYLLQLFLEHAHTAKDKTYQCFAGYPLRAKSVKRGVVRSEASPTLLAIARQNGSQKLISRKIWLYPSLNVVQASFVVKKHEVGS